MARFSNSINSLRPLFRRRSSKLSAADSNHSEDYTSDTTAATSATPSPKAPTAPPKEKYRANAAEIPEELHEQEEDKGYFPSSQHLQQRSESAADVEQLAQKTAPVPPSLPKRTDSLAAKQHLQSFRTDPAADLKSQVREQSQNPVLVVQEPTPVPDGAESQLPNDSSQVLERPAEPALSSASPDQASQRVDLNPIEPHSSSGAASATRSSSGSLPSQLRQSILRGADDKIVHTLVDVPDNSSNSVPTSALRQHLTDSVPNLSIMLHRKIWVKRPNASATLVAVRQEDLVDDVRDMILKKYANSLSKTFDAPDMNLTVMTRADPLTQSRSMRVLGPEEEMIKVIDELYPGGQTVEEALIIDVPTKRTPKPSPRHFPTHHYHNLEDYRPLENGTDYFPPMPMVNAIQPSLPQTAMPQMMREHHHSLVASDHPARSIAVLNTGQLPPLPSPGGRRHREREHRPKYGRQHTSSPVIPSHPNAGTTGLNTLSLSQHNLPLRGTRARVDSSASERPNNVPPAPPLPTPPAPEAPPTNNKSSSPPTPNGSTSAAAHSNRPLRPRKSRKPTPDKSKYRGQQNGSHGGNVNLPSISSMLDASVPPINVLIVEDNIINLRILEGLMKRLKVRWQTAMNGQIAVDKWKAGGFHLVLMDIQMPIMNGLQATKEIRRLERVNTIGVFSSSAPSSPAETRRGTETNGEESGTEKVHDASKDKLVKSEGFFKSPIIIVALTASSLQSDRHEALAAGCNDFLTKPVDFMWLERKVKEWGCMQALIDYDGWRKWKDYAAKEEEGKSEEQKRADREKEEKERIKMEKMTKLQEMAKKKEEARKKKNATDATASTTSLSGTSE